MTEKRFKIADYPTDIEDTQTGEKYPCSSYGTHMEIICDLLNELNNENEQLKDALNQRTEQCDKYYEENEQLKRQLQSIIKLTRKIEDCTHDVKLIGDLE